MFNNNRRWFVSLPQLLAYSAVTVTLLLLTTGRLTLYVHPRYLWFTGLMAATTLLLLLLHARQQPREADPPPTAAVRNHTTNLLATLMLIPLLLLPHTPLSAQRAVQTSQTAVQTSQTQSSASTATNFSPELLERATSTQNFALWAQLLAAGATAAELSGSTATVQGFITPGPNPNTFLLTRYSVTCCVVDAQAVTIPVYLPQWQNQHQPGQWLTVTGFFSANPDAAAQPTTVLQPGQLTPTTTPSNPYLPATGAA